MYNLMERLFRRKLFGVFTVTRLNLSTPPPPHSPAQPPTVQRQIYKRQFDFLLNPFLYFRLSTYIVCFVLFICNVECTKENKFQTKSTELLSQLFKLVFFFFFFFFLFLFLFFFLNYMLVKNDDLMTAKCVFALKYNGKETEISWITLYNLVVSFLLNAGHDTDGCRINTMLQLDEGKKKKNFFFEHLE